MANVVLNTEEVWKLGDEVRALTEAEKDMLAEMKVMMNSNQKLIIPSLKSTNKKEIKDVMVERKKKLKKKQVHGKIMNDIEEVGTKEMWQWLQGGYIIKSMQSFIMAAQEQALQTQWFRSPIQKEDVNPKCRLCDVEIETVCHLSAGCSKLSKGPYKRRHD